MIQIDLINDQSLLFQVAVVGVPDQRLGENICACVITKPDKTVTKEDMLDCFKETYQTDEGLGMTPSYFIFMDKFPLINAKVDRVALKAMAIQKLDL